MWRAEVGLSGVDPNGLALLNDDATCDRLWRILATRPPLPGYHVTFFRLGDLFIVTEYPNHDPTLGPRAMGLVFTSVVDAQFNQVEPLLVE